MWRNILFFMIALVCSSGCNSTGSETLTRVPEAGDIRTLPPTSETSQVDAEPTTIVVSSISIPYQDRKTFEGNLDFQLLIKTPEEELETINLSNEKIEYIQLLPDSIAGYPVVSPDGSLMAFIIRQGEQKYLQVKKFSSNGDEISAPLPKEAVVIRWLTRNKIAIWGGSADWECLHFLLIFDTIETEINYPKYTMPDLATQECIQLPVQDPSGNRMIYPWQMFDFQNGVITDVFPFFMDLRKNPPTYVLRWKDENVSIAYAAKDSLIYFLNIPVTDIKTEKVPKITNLPGLATKGGWWQPMVWWQNQSMLGVDLIDVETDPLELLASGHQVPTRFYLLDFDNERIIDYELDRGVFSQSTPVQKISNGFPSPDGKYYAWVIYDGVSGLTIGSKILELSSGYVLSIPRVEALGWVILD